MRPNPAWLHTAQLNRDLTQKLTISFASECLNLKGASPKIRRVLLDKILDVIRDPAPEKTLTLTAQHPLPLYRPGLVSQPITPTRKWQEIEAGHDLWPAEVKRKAKPLGLGSGRLPTWNQIKKYYDGVGFEAIPVHGYVGSPIYSFLVSNQMAPVCTSWVMRFKKAPYYSVPTDTLHDLGHGLGFAMADYRKLIVSFSKAALETGRFIISKDMDKYYGRYFEYSHVYNPQDHSVESIGAAPMIFETVKRRGAKLYSVIRDTRYILAQGIEFRPFASRKEWLNEGYQFIERMRKMRKS